MSFLLSLKFCQKAFTPVKISSFYFSNTLPNKTFKMANQTPLVWIDCEMTGLDSSVDHLLEIAVIITDSELNLLHEGIELVINHPRSVLDGMNEWCQVHHKQSGLIDRVLESEIQLSKAEDIVFEYITRFVEKAGVAPLAGNSVHADKQFLVKYMPKVTNYLHYRIVDVSTVKELAHRWFPKQLSLAPTKQLQHRALQDIVESIQELKYYRSSIFTPQSN